MESILNLITTLSIFAIAALSPGPSNLSIIELTMSNGKNNGILLALGVSFGTFLWSLSSAVGFNVYIVDSQFFDIVKVFGGIYLMKLAYDSFSGVWKNKRIVLNRLKGKVRKEHFFFKGILISLSNPKSALFWISIMSLLLADNSSTWLIPGMIVGCTTLAIFIYCSLAVMFNNDIIVSVYNKNYIIIGIVFGSIYLSLGAKLLLS